MTINLLALFQAATVATGLFMLGSFLDNLAQRRKGKK